MVHLQSYERAGGWIGQQMAGEKVTPHLLESASCLCSGQQRPDGYLVLGERVLRLCFNKREATRSLTRADKRSLASGKEV